MRSFKKALLLKGLISGFAACGDYKVGFDWLPPGAFTDDGAFVRDDAAFMDSCGNARITSLIHDPVGSFQWPRCRDDMQYFGTYEAFKLRHDSVAVLGALSLLSLLGFARLAMTERPAPKVMRGRKHLAGKSTLKELRHLSTQECKQSGYGLQFPPGIPISRDRESRHFLIGGSTGAGKTTAMLHLMLQVIARGDKVLILDVKGDMTATLPRLGNIIAPHDGRSLQWDIATDYWSPQEARELAARLIPESRSDRIWSDAAREILTACVVSLQVRHGDRWGWSHLRELVVADAEALLDVAERFHPEAIQFLKEPGSKTTHSIISTFKAHMNVASVLAEAWPNSSRERPFSVRKWLSHPACHPIVLQHDGRSKGISVVLGAQDLSQIRKTYGHDQADAWIGMIGTHIITRMNLGQSAETTSRLIGQQTVEHYRKSETRAGGSLSTTWTREREVRPVITLSELSDRLGALRDGVRALLIGPREHAYEITLPCPGLREIRPASMLADWTAKPARELAPLPDRPGSRQASLLSPEDAQRIRTSFSREHDA